VKLWIPKPINPAPTRMIIPHFTRLSMCFYGIN
jgi:hypothetical protein